MRKQTTHSGCKLATPNFDAIVPVMNGRTAEPACPKPEIQPTAPDRTELGIRRPDMFMTMG